MMPPSEGCIFQLQLTIKTLLHRHDHGKLCSGNPLISTFPKVAPYSVKLAVQANYNIIWFNIPRNSIWESKKIAELFPVFLTPKFCHVQPGTYLIIWKINYYQNVFLPSGNGPDQVNSNLCLLLVAMGKISRIKYENIILAIGYIFVIVSKYALGYNFLSSVNVFEPHPISFISKNYSCLIIEIG